MSSEGNKTVLFVDDDEAVLRSLERGLLEESYDKLFAGSGEEALEILKHNNVDLIITDMQMPEMNGLELLRIAGKKYPGINGIVLTGYELNAELLKAVEQKEILKIVGKPLCRLGGKFVRLVRWALEQSSPRHVRAEK